MNGILANSNRNSDRPESRIRIENGMGGFEANIEPNMKQCPPEPPTPPIRSPIDIQLQDVNGKIINCGEAWNEDLSGLIVETEIFSKDEDLIHLTIEETEKFEEVNTTYKTNKHVQIQENVPSFQEQIANAFNKMNRKPMGDAPYNFNSLHENDKNELQAVRNNVNGKVTTTGDKSLKEDLNSQNYLREANRQNCKYNFEKIEKYEEARQTEVTQVQENGPSLQERVEQIEQILRADNKINRQKLLNEVLLLKIKSLNENGSEENDDDGFSIHENRIDNESYTTAQTLRMRTMKDGDRLQKTEQRNTNVYNRRSSSENEQETENLLDKPNSLKKSRKDDKEPNLETEKVVIHQEYGYQYKEKHCISKVGKQCDDSCSRLLEKPVETEQIPLPVITTQPARQEIKVREISPSKTDLEKGDSKICNGCEKKMELEQTKTEQKSLPVITCQPGRQEINAPGVNVPSPKTDLEIMDEVDTKICNDKMEEEHKCADSLNKPYESSCLSDCLFYTITCFV